MYPRQILKTGSLGLLTLISSTVAINKDGFQGPLIDHFADPAMIEVNGTHYAFATGPGRGPGDGYIQVASSLNLVDWTIHDAALPHVNSTSWIGGGAKPDVWAPDVVEDVVNGGWLLYFSAALRNGSNPHCLGVAHAENILGPYEVEDEPLHCPKGGNGAIDVSHFYHGLGSNETEQWITYKWSGASGNGSPELRLVELEASGKMAGRRVNAKNSTEFTILNTGPEDNGDVEGPFLFHPAADQYVLLFCSGNFANPSYKTGIATAKSLKGPYTRQDGFLVQTSKPLDALNGPGGMQVERRTHRFGQVAANDSIRVAFHNRQVNGTANGTANSNDTHGDIRALWTAYIHEVDGVWKIDETPSKANGTRAGRLTNNETTTCSDKTPKHTQTQSDHSIQPPMYTENPSTLTRKVSQYTESRSTEGSPKYTDTFREIRTTFEAKATSVPSY